MALTMKSKSKNWHSYNNALIVALTLIINIGCTTKSSQRNLTEGMVLIPAGSFAMGCSDCKMDDALPVHEVQLDSFWLDATPVTNAQFKKFVDDTGYKTIAERPLNPNEFPGADPKDLVPGSIVFVPPPTPVDLGDYSNW